MSVDQAMNLGDQDVALILGHDDALLGDPIGQHRVELFATREHAPEDRLDVESRQRLPANHALYPDLVERRPVDKLCEPEGALNADIIVAPFGAKVKVEGRHPAT